MVNQIRELKRRKNMAQNYYDEFVKLPLDKMAQKMEDMT
ncbi:conserved hypothetical protein, partial [Enterococcus faecium E4453]